MIKCDSLVLMCPIDISKYRLPVLQTFDAMQASADWLTRDKQDVEAVSVFFLG
jgi:hypothetical protein